MKPADCIYLSACIKRHTRVEKHRTLTKFTRSLKNQDTIHVAVLTQNLELISKRIVLDTTRREDHQYVRANRRNQIKYGLTEEGSGTFLKVIQALSTAFLSKHFSFLF